jgi:hypothetical protein
VKTRFDDLQKEFNNQIENLARVTAAQHYSDAALHFEQTDKLLKAEQNSKFKAWIGAPNNEMDFSGVQTRNATRIHADGFSTKTHIRVGSQVQRDGYLSFTEYPGPVKRF